MPHEPGTLPNREILTCSGIRCTAFGNGDITGREVRRRNLTDHNPDVGGRSADGALCCLGELVDEFTDLFRGPAVRQGHIDERHVSLLQS